MKWTFDVLKRNKNWGKKSTVHFLDWKWSSYFWPALYLYQFCSIKHVKQKKCHKLLLCPAWKWPQLRSQQEREKRALSSLSSPEWFIVRKNAFSSSSLSTSAEAQYFSGVCQLLLWLKMWPLLVWDSSLNVVLRCLAPSTLVVLWINNFSSRSKAKQSCSPFSHSGLCTVWHFEL